MVVAGAGMAGLAAAAEARARGADVLLLEKGDVAGGAMAWSSGVIWRHAAWEDFRRECPSGDAVLQRLVFERLDDDLDWLEAHGALVAEPETGNPRTVGRRFDAASIARSLARDVRVRTPLRSLPGVPLVLATGGFAASPELLREHVTRAPVLLRSTPWSTGDGLRLGLDAGGALSAGMDEVYGRVMPDAPLVRDRWITDAQLYARFGELRDGDARFVSSTWSEIDAVQWLARRPSGRAWLVVRPDVLGERTPYGTVAEQIERAAAAGASVRRSGDEVAVRVA